MINAMSPTLLAIALPLGQPVERRHHALDEARWIRETWARYVRGEP